MLEFFQQNYQRKLMMNSENKSILFSSQSFYPGIGGVSTLLLNLSKYLSNLNYKLYAIHLEMPRSANSSVALSYPVNEYIIPKSEITKDIYEGYATFKEEIYQHLHGLKKFNYENIYDVPGYSEFMQLSDIYAYYLLNALSENDIDIVHFQDYQVMLGISAIPSGVKSVFSLHAPLLKSIDPVLSKWFFKHLQKTDKVILSIPQYADIARNFGIQNNKISVITPIIDKDLMSKKVKLNIAYSIPKNAIVICCVQRFDSKSGQEQLVRAFSKLARKIENVCLLFVGESSFTDSISETRKNYFQQIKDLVFSHGLTSKVIFTGNIDYSQLSTIYDLSDIVVILSKMECFCLAVSEAMSKEKPIVVTNVGGLAYQVKDNFNGYLVKPGDVEQTFKALMALCESKELRYKFSRRSRERFINEFDPIIIIPKYHRLYQSLFSKKNIKNIDYENMYNLLR